MHATQSIRRRIATGLLSAGVALATSYAGANGLDSVLLEQGFTSGNNSFLVSISGGLESAESFSLGSNSVVTSISWWSTAESTSGWNVSLADSLGGLVQGSSILSGSLNRGSSDGQDSSGSDVFRFDLVLSAGRDLNAGEHFLFIWNDDPDLAWSWAAGAAGDGHSFLAEYDQNLNRTWVSDAGNDLSSDLAIQIRGREQQSVPEPGTLALIGLAGLGLASVMRRRSPDKT
ncbi:MAG: PEP-CTERM sorting domain-containing protein [Proteobacteria bacterium]|nr:PEP-CTERM sorting domain-containing protein [Pseudomonadota bacterium]